MSKKTNQGFPHDATPDLHRLCADDAIKPVSDPIKELPFVVPGSPHEWREMRLGEENSGGTEL